MRNKYFARGCASHIWRCSIAAAAVGGFAAVSCSSGPERSVESFCTTLRSEKERILAQIDQGSAAAEAQSDELASGMMSLGVTLQALGELRTYFHELADVAPDEVRTEVEIIRDEVDKQFDTAGDAASNPLGSLAEAVVSGFAMSGQMETVNNFAKDNCGEGI